VGRLQGSWALRREACRGPRHLGDARHAYRLSQAGSPCQLLVQNGLSIGIEVVADDPRGRRAASRSRSPPQGLVRSPPAGCRPGTRSRVLRPGSDRPRTRRRPRHREPHSPDASRCRCLLARRSASRPATTPAMPRPFHARREEMLVEGQVSHAASEGSRERLSNPWDWSVRHYAATLCHGPLSFKTVRLPTRSRLFSTGLVSLDDGGLGFHPAGSSSA
jgi:hypothetical protein